jgi:hypothetical protein
MSLSKKEIIISQDQEIKEIPEKVLVLSQFSLLPEVIKIICNYFFKANISLGIRIWALKIENLLFTKEFCC